MTACPHLDTIHTIRLRADTKTIEEVCYDCGVVVKLLVEHVAPVRGVIDECPAVAVDVVTSRAERGEGA